MSAASKILFRYAYNGMSGRFWLDENSSSVVLPLNTGETTIAIYANNYITEFSKFKSYLWTALNTVDLPLLKELDLSGSTGLVSSDFFNNGVYTGSYGLKNIETLNLSNIKLLSSDSKEVSAYELDVSKCSKLKNLNVSSSSITSIVLPTSAIL
jgi:hypothetical protein